MVKFKTIPVPIQLQIFYAFIIGVCCLLVGLCVHLYLSDWILLSLSVVIFLFCIGKGIQLYRIGIRSRYSTLDTVCNDIANRRSYLRRKRIHIFEDTEGHIFHLYMPQHISKGQSYRLYFTKLPYLDILWQQPDYLITLTLSSRLIGIEQTNNI